MVGTSPDSRWIAIPFTFGATILLACGGDAASGPATPDPPTAGDLTISCVQRLPGIDHVWGSDQPDVEGWPTPGQTVTWRAHDELGHGDRARASTFPVG